MGGISEASQDNGLSQIGQNSAQPGAQPTNNLSTILNGAGLLMNVLGAAKGAGAAGNSLLDAAQHNDNKVGQQQKAAQKVKDDALETQEAAEGIKSLQPRIDNLDETYQPYAQTLAKQGDLKSLSPYLEHAEGRMSAAVQRDEVNGRANDRIAEVAQKAADAKLGKDASGMDKSLAGAQALLAKSKVPVVEDMQRVRGVLLGAQDPQALVNNPNELKAALVAAGVKVGDKKAFAGLQSDLAKYVDSKTANGILGTKFGAKLPDGIPKEQVFGDFIQTHTAPALLQEHQTNQSASQAIQAVRSQLKDPDQKEQGIRNAQILNQAMQAIRSGKPEQVQKGHSALQKLGSMGQIQ